MEPIRFFKIIELTFQKLLLTHALVHLHHNNAVGIVNINGFLAPRVFEITMIKRTRARIQGFADLPHPLDRGNICNLPDLQLPDSWK